MKIGSRRDYLLLAAGALIVVGLYAGYSKYMVAADDSPRVGSGTLNPALFAGDVREAYEVARQHPALLAQLHCYCGCDKVEGHRNLLDCFRDTHGGRCRICINEVLQAKRMAEEGSPLDQIRDALRARYDHQS